MTVRAVDVARSRVVLIGVPRYRHPELSDLPSVADNVADLAGMLTDPALGGFPAAHCITAPEDATVSDVGELLHEAADQAEDLLLCYYSGHGKVDDWGELYLTLAGTNIQRLAFSALPFGAVRNALRTSGARNRVVILDTCYSGRATAATLSTEEDEVLTQLEVAGGYTLTSSPATRPSLVYAGERNTAFTGRLLTLLREGSPEAGELLTLRDIYRHLRTRLSADGLPAPQQCGTATVDALGLVRNRTPRRAELPADITEGLESRFSWVRLAAVGELGRRLAVDDRADANAARAALEKVAANDNPQVAVMARSLLDAAPLRTSSPLVVRAMALLDEAERLAADITDKDDRRRALVSIAYAIPHLPERLDRVLAMLSEVRESVLVGLSKKIAPTDPDRAERLARAITDTALRVEALGPVAAAVHDSDPLRSRRLFDEAERDLEVFVDGRERERNKVALATAAASCDPDRADRLAATIEAPRERLETVIVIGAAAATAARTERIANDVKQHAEELLPLRDSLPVLAQLAAMLMPVNPVRAASIFDHVERTARETEPRQWQDRLENSFLPTHDDYHGALTKTRTLCAIAKATGVSDLSRTERIIASITGSAERKLQALTCVLGDAVRESRLQRGSRVTAAAKNHDTVRLIRLADEIERLVTTPHARFEEFDLVWAVQAVAFLNPVQAKRLIAVTTYLPNQGYLRAILANTVALTDPDDAERIAIGITEPTWKVCALAGVAGQLLGMADSRTRTS